MEFYDTLNTDFKVLKAYIKNDTSFFSRLKKDIVQSQQDAIFYGRDDSCVKQETLSDLKVDKAYRFKHWEAFCFFNQNITVALSGNKVNLHYIEYSSSPEGKSFTIIKSNGDTLKVGPTCTIVKEFDKTLSMMDWEVLERKVRDADYWGMKEKEGGGLDGSIWQIDAFIEEKFPARTVKSSHSVWRFNVPSKCFKDIARYMLQLSGEKTMCGSLN